MASTSAIAVPVTPVAPRKGSIVLAKRSKSDAAQQKPSQMAIDEVKGDLQSKLQDVQEVPEGGFVLEDLMDEGDITYQVFVTYPKYDSHLAVQALSKIDRMIKEDQRISKDLLYRCEYGQVKDDPSRLSLVVAFEGDAEAAKHFSSAEEVVLDVVNRGRVRFPISQPSKWVSKEDGSILFFIKRMPNSINLKCTEKIMGLWKFGKMTRPFVQKVVSMEYLRHKSSAMFRGMAAGYLIPHEDDPDCISIPGSITVPLRRPSPREPNGASVQLVFGCEKHVCKCCGRTGHLMEVCKFWPQKARGKKRTFDDTLDERVFLDDAIVPDTPVLKEAKEDLLIQFLQGKGFSKQAWVCTGCPGDTYVQGNSYIGLAAHMKSAKHQEAVIAYGKDAEVDEGAEAEEASA